MVAIDGFRASIAAMAAEADDYDRAAIAAARERATDELEVDDVTITSRGDDSEGCFVLAWMWVPRHDMDPVLEDE